MYHAIRSGSRRHVSQGHSNLLVRSLNACEPHLLGNMTQQRLAGSRSLHRLAKQSRGDELQIHTFTSRQRFREFHLPSTQSIPAVCRSDDNDESSDHVKDLVYLRRSSISQPTFQLKTSSPFHHYNNLARPRTSYNFESRLWFSGRTGAKIPTPKTESASSISSMISSMDPVKLLTKGADMTWYLAKTLISFLLRLPGNTLYYLMNGDERRAKIAEIKDMAKKEFDHYWTGSKLLMADVRTARNLMGKTLTGNVLTRRERKQLLRTVSDLFRLIPFSMFVIIPMMEFLLPFALRLFPNMLPSTFQDSLKSEENMKRELKSRIAMAQFFQDTLEELAKEQKRIVVKRKDEKPDDEVSSKQIESAASMLEFLERARNGEMMPPEVIIQYANFFKDDLTLDNMPRMQLINMCKYMGIAPYGSDNFLRFQLRYKIRSLKEDDQRILWEGIDSLTKMELREACQERGMRSTGLSKEAYKRSLQQWLELSVNYDVPISLLIMSRTYFLHDEVASSIGGDRKGVAGLADAISGLDKDVLNEVILEVATSEEKKSSPDVRKIQLEVVSKQNEKIAEEQAERKRKEESAKAKESVDKPAEKPEVAAAEAAKQGAEPISEPVIEQVSEAPVPKKQEAVVDFIAEVKDGKAADTDKKVIVKIVDGETKVDDEAAVVVPAAELSADEIEAIEQLVSADPVSKERKDLERIKSAMKDNKGDAVETPAEKEAASDQEVTTELAEQVVDDLDSAAKKIESMEKKAAKEAEEFTVFTTYKEGEKSENTSVVDGKSEIIKEDPEPEPEEDVVVARLKKRIADMVDKIEVQLSKAELQIGNKLHLLDKDQDGILTQEEIVQCLQEVLKRPITTEEARELALEMDHDGDGVLTVQELVSWLEKNKLIRLESEGKYQDVDRIREGQQGQQSGGVQIEDETSDQSGKQKQ